MRKSVNIYREEGCLFTVPTQWLLQYLKNDTYNGWEGIANDDEILFDFECNYDYDEAETIYNVATQELIECVECCPHCDGDQYPLWDVGKYGYEINCPNCGELIMLCNECLHADDNKNMFCDWRNGKCFRKNI